MFHRFGEFLGNISGRIWPHTGDRQLPPSVGVLSSRWAPLVSAVTYLLAPFGCRGGGIPAAWPAPAPVVIIQRASASAEWSGQARAREWGNSYRHAELSEQSTKQARRARWRWRQAYFTGFSSAPALHWATTCTLSSLPSPSRGRARSVPLASEGFLSPLSWRVGVGGGDCSIQVVRLMAPPSPAQPSGGGGYGGAAAGERAREGKKRSAEARE